MPKPIRVLFVCTHNSARSQIAEALLGSYGGGDFDAHSAGVDPSPVSPYAVRALAEAGIDWSGARSRGLDGLVDQPWDYVVTVCDYARQVCPKFPGAESSLHWGLDDPEQVAGTDDERLAAFRRSTTEVSTWRAEIDQ